MLLACGNIFEILRHTFPSNLVAGRFISTLKYAFLGLIVYFCVAVTYGHWVWQMHYLVIERDFRSLQALFMLVLLLGIYYFGLPLGREVKAIFCGYSLYIATSLATLALEARFSMRFDPYWRFLQPLSYIGSLLIFLIGFCTPGSRFR